MMDDSPFYLTVIPERRRDGHGDVWYYKTPMGHNTLNGLIPEACKRGGIAVKTNHASRKTCIRTLSEAGAQDHKTAQISGHKDPHSIANYDTKKLSLVEHKEFSRILDRLPEDRDPEIARYASYSGMTLHGNVKSLATHTVTRMTQLSVPLEDGTLPSAVVSETTQDNTMVVPSPVVRQTTPYSSPVEKGAILGKIVGDTGVSGGIHFNNCTFNFGEEKANFDLGFSLSPSLSPLGCSPRPYPKKWRRIMVSESGDSSQSSQ
jgi:hypothetical protein